VIVVQWIHSKLVVEILEEVVQIQEEENEK
jgi:hypothetical protein